MATKKRADPGPSCQHCRHYVAYIHDGTDQGWGECKRYPPSVHMVDGEDGPEPISLYATVEPTDVCGELVFKN